MTSRRSFLALAASVPALAQQTRDWTNQQVTRYPDPDVVEVDPSFAKYKLFNAVIYRHYVGCQWAEGPAWSTQGQYLLWRTVWMIPMDTGALILMKVKRYVFFIDFLKVC